LLSMCCSVLLSMCCSVLLSMCCSVLLSMCCSVLFLSISRVFVYLSLCLSVPHSRSFSVCLSFTLSLFLSLSRPILLVFSRFLSFSFAIFLSRHRFTRLEVLEGSEYKVYRHRLFFLSKSPFFSEEPRKRALYSTKEPYIFAKEPCLSIKVSFDLTKELYISVTEKSPSLWLLR